MATAVAIGTMKVAQISKPGAGFQIVEREIPEPAFGQVRIKVQACGVCHSDMFVKDGLWPGIEYPRVPGHEVAGIIDEIGPGVSAWKRGQRVGVGWHGGQDNTCVECRRGRFLYCRSPRVAGISYDGGYQQYMVAPIEALASIPDTLSDAEAGPLLCAGVTTFNALRHGGASPGTLVAVQGVGGLGHLGVQFASKFGCKVVAIGRGAENATLANKLGAAIYIDSASTNAAQELQKLGGAQVILATAPNSKSMAELIDGLAPTGKLMVVGISTDPMAVTPLQLIIGERSIQGSAVGTPSDSEDTMNFADLTGVRPMIETYPLEQADEAYARMMSGQAQFRVVLTM
jgi:D-arabinose 1-dehydrogenase-like Zn-dependent alcohol dehydrogenase